MPPFRDNIISRTVQFRRKMGPTTRKNVADLFGTLTPETWHRFRDTDLAYLL